MSYTTATLGLMAVRNQVKVPAQRIGSLDMDEEEVHSYSDKLQYGFLVPSTLNTIAECMEKAGKAIEQGDRDKYKRNVGILQDLIRIVPENQNIYTSTMNIQENDLQVIASREDIFDQQWADILSAKREFAFWAADNISFDDETGGMWRVWKAVPDFPAIQGVNVESARTTSTRNQGVKGNVAPSATTGHHAPSPPTQMHGANVPSSAANTITPNAKNWTVPNNTVTQGTSSSATDTSQSRLKKALESLKEATSR